jgi:hypothetical protein
VVSKAEAIEEKGPNTLKKERQQINHLYCQTLHYIKTSPYVSNRLMVARLIAQGELALGLQEILSKEETLYYTKDWHQNLFYWIKYYPNRSDQAVTYLLLALMSNQENDAYTIAKEIYLNNPKDPVGLWFTGIIMLNNPAQATDGLSRLKSALNNGIERFMPVDDEIKNQLLINQ